MLFGGWRLREELEAAQARCRELEQALAVARAEPVAFPTIDAETQRQLHLYQLVAHKTSSGMMVTDDEGRIIWCNRAFEDMCGYRLAELVGKKPGAILQGADTDPLTVEYIRECLRHDRGFKVEILNYHKSGRTYWVEIDADPVRDHQGGLVHFVAIQTDVTERRRTLEALRESERRLQDLSEAAGEFIWDLDQKGRFTYVSPRVREILGYEPDDLVGRYCVELAPPDDLIRLQEALTVSRDRRVTRNFEHRLKNRRGGQTWLRSNIIPRWDDNHLLMGFRGATLDITAEKQAESQRVQMLGALESSSDGIAITDASGIFTYMNYAHAAMYGYAGAEELLGKSWLVLYDESEGKRIINDGIPTLMAHRHFLGFAQGLRKDGTHFPEEFALTLLPDGCILCVCRDATSRLQAENRLRQAKEEAEKLNRRLEHEILKAQSLAETAERANRAKNAFLGHISHELRTPLNGILGYAQLLIAQVADQPQLSHGLGVIQKSGEHLLDLINDILDFSKLESGQMQLQPQPVALGDFLFSLMELVRMQAEAKGLRARLELPEAMPEMVCVDRRALRQVLINLLGNAVKFTPQGEVVLRLAVAPSEGEMGLRFTVRDTGPGIAPERQETIFEEFQPEGRGAEGEARTGVGLGLAICRRLVRRLGGELAVESQAGAGAAFSFEIRARREGPCACETPVSTQKHLSGYAGPRQSILVADDVPTNRAVLRGLLESMGFGVLEASNGEEALAVLAENPVIACLVDVAMPVMDGVEFARHVREHAHWQALPVVAITAFSPHTLGSFGQSTLFDAYLSKPLQVSDLETMLTRHLQLDWEWKVGQPPFVPSALAALTTSSTTTTEDIRPALPRELIDELLAHANHGNLKAVRECLAPLTPSQTQAELRRLADTYQVEALCELLQRLREAIPQP